MNPDRLTVSNGENDLNQMGQVIHLNGKSMLHPWSTNSCNSVGGSDGMFYPRDDVQNGRPVYLFHKDSCRKMPMVFHSKEKVNVRNNTLAREGDVNNSKTILTALYYCKM